MCLLCTKTSFIGYQSPPIISRFKEGGIRSYACLYGNHTIYPGTPV